MNKKTLVFGSLNTDLIIEDVQKILEPGELTSGKNLRIAPGGKSRNIAAMLANLTNSGEDLVFIGKTYKDEKGFWEYPVRSLEELDIDTSNIIYSEDSTSPGLAIIPVDRKGNNQIYLVPGANNEFSKEDILSKSELFSDENTDSLVLTFEMPVDTAKKIFELSRKNNKKLFVDPGGIEANRKFLEVLDMGAYFIKPNEHEVKIITGIQVIDEKTASKAGAILLQKGYENVLITLGGKGGYFIQRDLVEYISIPKINLEYGDSIGCGDQTMAGILYALKLGKNILDACKIGVIAGTLQFHKKGVAPITKLELEEYIK
jgi:ribokinase